MKLHQLNLANALTHCSFTMIIWQMTCLRLHEIPRNVFTQCVNSLLEISPGPELYLGLICFFNLLLSVCLLMCRVTRFSVCLLVHAVELCALIMNVFWPALFTFKANLIWVRNTFMWPDLHLTCQ